MIRPLKWLKFRFPDLQGIVNGILDQAKDHFGTGLRVTERLVSQVGEQETQCLVMRRGCHAMDVDGQRIGALVRLDVTTGDEQSTHQRAGLILLVEVLAQHRHLRSGGDPSQAQPVSATVSLCQPRLNTQPACRSGKQPAVLPLFGAMHGAQRCYAWCLALVCLGNLS